MSQSSESDKTTMKHSGFDSVKSGDSMAHPLHFEIEDPSSRDRFDSVKSGDSMAHPLHFEIEDPSSRDRFDSVKSGDSMAHPLHFEIEDPSSRDRFVSVRSVESMEHPPHLNNEDPSSGHRPDPLPAGAQIQTYLKINLKKRFQCLEEVITNQKSQAPLNEIYTELHITEGVSGGISNEHEVRQIEAAPRKSTTVETSVKCSDIFKPLSEQDKPIRTVLTKGISGIGKTVSVQKFILDWAEDKANQDLQFIFPFPFRELNLMTAQKLSLLDLLHKCVQETGIETSSLHKALFILDGLDECRLPLDFQSSERVCDVTVSASVDVLLINLIKGNLLPSALIWITSRPAAADQIPSEYVDRVTEVRGFTDPQKEEYFRRRISDEDLANSVTSHLKTSRSLYIMCHIPVFCWISATVLERVLGEAGSGEIPKTLTQMYTHFLIIQTQIIREKYTQIQNTDEEILLKLGHLAFQQLMRGNLIFYEEDLRECGIHVQEASVYSGVCTQIFREESGLLQSKVYCFVHLSVQEHLAALYTHMTFMDLKQRLSSKQNCLKKSISDLHKNSVDQALQSKNGHLDLFLRFLLGLSLESNQMLLQNFITQTGSSSYSNEETVRYIRKKIRENPSTEKSINLFHCLNELGDHSLVEEVQLYLQSGNLQSSTLSQSQWSAVVFVLMTSSQEIDVFTLSKYIDSYSRSEEVLLKLLPVVAASRKADFYNCSLKNKSCKVLAPVLSSEFSNLKELDLSENDLGDSGVKLLSGGLKNPHCKLETLRLCNCKIKYEGCLALSLALKSNHSHLMELDMSWNEFEDSGVKCLSSVLEKPDCKLERLRLWDCKITDEGCAALASALTSNPSHLRVLDLSKNKLENSGVKLLTPALEHPLCKIETLWLLDCCISDEGCASISLALNENPSHLKELNLSENKLADSGVKLLSPALGNPHCKLESLRLCNCNIKDEGCAALALALKTSHLRELDLSWNELEDSGVKLLSAVLKNPLCTLEKLRLNKCNITNEGCAALVSALKSNPSHLRALDLSENKLEDSGVKLLSDLRDDKHYRLQELLEVTAIKLCVFQDQISRMSQSSESDKTTMKHSGFDSVKSGDSMAHPLHFEIEDPSSRDRPDPLPAGAQIQTYLKINLKKRFQCLEDVITNQKSQAPLNEIYTELHITEGVSGGISNEHEVRQIEAAPRKSTTVETSVKCSDIFKPLSEQDKPIRTVLTKGVTGIGKTVSVQKFILDWAEDKAHQDLQFIFPFPFRELNLMTAQKLSLLDLLHKCVQETGIETSSLHKALFVFDGLDECRLPLDFQSSESVCDVTESASVDVLLINLIKGNLLPSALIWITSRPAAADQIPSEYVDRVTEVRGFTDTQKEEYFRRRISDEDLANRVISHLKTSRSLYIMCHIPVFCWISATVLERLLGEAESGEIPKTLTQMYTHFLIIQTQIIREKYTQIQNTDEEILLKLGHLAFQQLMRGNLIFYEEDLRECGIHVQEASVYSGVCTQIFREESGLLQSKVYCFVHLSVQEHLAALYTHMTFMDLKQRLSSKQNCLKKSISDLHKSTVDQALQSKNGQLDLFLRFLLGLSLESNQMLLQDFITQTGSSSYSNEETVRYIKKKIRENPSTEKSINLFHCLNELGDHSLVEEVQLYLQSGNLQSSTLSHSQWSAVVFVLMTSSQEIDVFTLSKYIDSYSRSEEVLLKLLPVVTASRKADFYNCSLKNKSCKVLASVLSSEFSNLRELDLSENDLGDSGVKLLSGGLKNPNCKLETLRLWDCKITDEGCAALASALTSNPSHPRVLDLSKNKLGNSGVKLLTPALENPLCKLETLWLLDCCVSDEGCAAMSSALNKNPSHLKELNLSENKLADSGVKMLSPALGNPHCKLESLSLCNCNIKDEGCAALALALETSHLRELDLSWNELEDSGVKLLSAVLKNPLCTLEKLRLNKCNITDEGCAALVSALKSNPLTPESSGS
ncbi:hypothetical protein NFI96_024891, partial [Prochilodus magdalenae]